MAVFVVIADVVGVCLAVVRILRRADHTDRHLSFGGVAVGGALTAIVALRAGTLPFLVVLVLVGLAALAGVWFRPRIIRWRGTRDARSLTLVVRHHAFCEPVEVLLAAGVVGG